MVKETGQRRGQGRVLTFHARKTGTPFIDNREPMLALGREVTRFSLHFTKMTAGETRSEREKTGMEVTILQMSLRFSNNEGLSFRQKQ